MSKFKPGDTVYVKDNAEGWVQVQILRSLGHYYTVKPIDKNAAFGASEHRLLTEAEFNELPINKPEIQPPMLH